MIKAKPSTDDALPYAQVAVILPAHNEQQTVAGTIADFRAALPGAVIVVCDNASSDDTAGAASQAGALVIHEPSAGKGNAVRRLLATVDAEIYLMADADQTYDASTAAFLVGELRRRHLDMITGVRVHSQAEAYRTGHVLGNRFFNGIFARFFGTGTRDVFSGYRLLSRRFVRCLPVRASGFEIEVEMTATASVLKLPVGEYEVAYGKRPSGSASKLRTYRDGWIILRTCFRLVRHFHPKVFYGIGSVLLAALSMALGLPVVYEFLQTGLVPRFPTAILASSIGLISLMTFFAGLVLESIARLQIQQQQLFLRTQAD